MANREKQYRFQVFAVDSTTVDFTIDSSGFKSPPQLGGQRVDPLEGRADSIPTQLQILDPNSTFTARLSNAAGRTVLINRVGQVQTRVDDSTTWNTRYVGRITAIQDQVSHYDVTLYDEQQVARQTMAFPSLDWPSSSNMGSTEKYAFALAYPPGLVGDYLEYNRRFWYAAPRGGGGWQVNSNLVALPVPDMFTEFNGAYGGEWVSEEVLELLQSDVRNDIQAGADGLDPTSTEPTFNTLRAWVYDQWWPVQSVRELFLDTNAPATRLDQVLDYFEVALGVPAEQAANKTAVAYLIASSSVADAPSYGARLAMPDHAPTRSMPAHVGGDDGIHAFQFVKDVYDEIGVRYSSSQMDWLISQGTLMSAGMYWRITEPESAESLLRRLVYKPFGYVPFVDEEGRINPRSVLLPDPDAGGIEDVGTLPMFESTSVPEQPTWEQSAQDVVTAVKFTYTRQYGSFNGPRSGDYPDAFTFDLLWEEQVDLQTSSGGLWFEHDRLGQMGRHEHEIPLIGRYNPRVWTGLIGADSDRARVIDDLLPSHVRTIFQRYGDGAIRGRVVALSSDAPSSSSPLHPGHYARIGVGTYPNMNEQARSTEGRVVQLMAMTETMGGMRYEVLDVGVVGNPPDAPTLAMSCSTGDPHNSIRCSVTGMSTGATFQVQFRSTQGTPTSSAGPLWNTVASGTTATSTSIRVSRLPSGRTYYGRVRQISDDAVAGHWSSSYANHATDALTAPSGLSAESSGYNVWLTWAPGETDYPQLLLADEAATSSDVTLPLDEIATIPAGGNVYKLVGVAQDTTHYAELRTIDGFGGYSTADNVTFATTTDAPSGPTITDPPFELVEGEAT